MSKTPDVPENAMNGGGGDVSEERRSWPELVGKTWEEAQSVLTAAGMDAHMLLEGSPTTRDYREERVRVFVDAQQVVVELPMIG